MIKTALLSSSAIVLISASYPLFAQQSTETYTYDALGRLVVAGTDGGQNDDEVHSLCYDKAGNREEYTATSDGSTAQCVDEGSGSGGGGTPPPPPPPPPPNSPPVTQADSATVFCNQSATVNLTANDSDPESNYPLNLTSIVLSSGIGSSATIVSASSVSVSAFFAGSQQYTYTVEDSLGASSAGTLTVTVPPTGCNM